MFSTDDLFIDCQTCLAANTTACSDCVVSHLLANDDGPIDLELTPVLHPRNTIDRAVGLFANAGLVDEEPCFIDHADFLAGRVPSPVGS